MKGLGTRVVLRTSFAGITEGHMDFSYPVVFLEWEVLFLGMG